MVQERRQFPRIAPRAPLVISLGESKPGLLLDLCEGGVSVASLEPRSVDEVMSLTFDLPEGIGHIRVEGEVTWTRDSGHLTGVRFLDLADASRRQLEEWISIHATTQSASVTIPTEETGQKGPATVGEPLPQGLEPEQNDHKEAARPASADLAHPELEPDRNKLGPVLGQAPSPDSSPRYAIRIFLAVMLLSWALVFLGYRMGSTEMSPPPRESTATVHAPEANSTASPISSDLPVSSPAALHAVPWSDPGVVLQVGAMKEEGNADALALALQKKNFPTFVFQRGRGQLYRVAVGPYSAAEKAAAFKVQSDLQKLGFQAIVKHWLPQ